MASVSTNRKTGARRVLFISTDGTRKTLHVGKITMATAVEIGAHVDHLVRCQQAREDFRQSTQQSIEHIRRYWVRLAKRMVTFGLIPESMGSTAPRKNCSISFADFADQLMDARTDLKPNTTNMNRK